MRKFRLLAVVAAFASATSFGTAQASSAVPTNKDAGAESDDLASAVSWFTDQRAAPNAFINPNAYANVHS